MKVTRDHHHLGDSDRRDHHPRGREARHRQVGRGGRSGEAPQPQPSIRKEVHATAGDLAPVISDITGRTITRKQITYWGRAGYIPSRGGDGDAGQVYRLADVLDHAQKE